jgi:NCAIR mutase (PurE)-related protein
MNAQALRELLERVREGTIGVDSAVSELARLPFAELGFAKIDHHRALRMGFPEVVLGEGKSVVQIVGIARHLLEAKQNVLVTRVSPELAAGVCAQIPELSHHTLARTLTFEHTLPPPLECEPVAVVTAGTSDIPVAEEALETLRMSAVPTSRVFDIGVAGIHRLLERRDQLARAPVVIVVAGMEGALPSVVGGLVGAPVIAVPTSVGYGTALSGFTALFGMLTSCASGVTVVNIDNGFGAAVAAIRMLRGGLRA